MMYLLDQTTLMKTKAGYHISRSAGVQYFISRKRKISSSVLMTGIFPPFQIFSCPFRYFCEMPWSDSSSPMLCACIRICRLNRSLPVKYISAKAYCSTG